MGQAMSDRVYPEALVNDIGREWAVMHTSLKVHASCRHTHPAADALMATLTNSDIDADAIERVEVGVYQAALDVLGGAPVPTNTHQAKFSMGFVLALIAHRRRAGVLDFDADSITDPKLLSFASRVSMKVDPDIESLHPERWASEVKVFLEDGSTLSSRVESPRGDPDQWLSPDEIDDKFRSLARYAGQLDDAAIDALLSGLRGVGSRRDVSNIMSWGLKT